MYHFNKIVSVKDAYKTYKYRCHGIDDIYQANRNETASTALFHLDTYYEAFTQNVRGLEFSYTPKTAALGNFDFKLLLNILRNEYPPFLTIMLREEDISFKLHGLIADDLDRRKLSDYIPHLYTDAIPTLMICHCCGREWDGFAQCDCYGVLAPMEIYEGIAEDMEFHEVMEIDEDMEVKVAEIDEAMKIDEDMDFGVMEISPARNNFI